MTVMKGCCNSVGNLFDAEGKSADPCMKVTNMRVALHSKLYCILTHGMHDSKCNALQTRFFPFPHSSLERWSDSPHARILNSHQHRSGTDTPKSLALRHRSVLSAC